MFEVEKETDKVVIAESSDKGESGIFIYLQQRAADLVDLLSDSLIGMVEYCLQAN